MRAWIVLVVVLGLAGPVEAEINMADSIEWMTCDADLIVRGRPVKVTPAGDGWQDVEVTVDEVLVGDKLASVVVRVRAGLPIDWIDERAEAVLFVKAGTPMTLRAGAWGESGWVCLTCKRPARAFTMGAEVLEGRAAVLAAVKEGIGRRGATASAKIEVDVSSPAGRALYGGSAVWLYEPVDARYEAWAHAATRSKQVEVRAAGATALGLFRSDANVALLRRLLRDPGTAVTELDGRSWRVWPVRREALLVLTRWGLRPKHAPVVEQPIAPPKPKRKVRP
jgi:hypothetical protein